MLPEVVIIGNGVAGITVARYLRKYIQKIPIKIISDESPYFISRPAFMYVYMGNIRYKDLEPYERDFWKRNRFELVYNRVVNVDTDHKKIFYQDGSQDNYDILILATGSKPNRLGLVNEDINGIQGFYHLKDLKKLEDLTKQRISHAVVVGGGLIGIELAEMLHTKKIPVTFLVRESNYWNHVLPEEESHIINREIRKHHIDLRLSTIVKEIQGEKDFISFVVTDKGEKIKTHFMGVSIGVSPNIDFLKKSKIHLNKGILVNYFFETNIPSVYAVGDCAQFKNVKKGEKPIEQLWYTAKLQAMALAGILIQRIAKNHSYSIPFGIDRQFEFKYLKKENPYHRGIWYNSAKFFTIEYQTYGMVPAKPQHTFVWQDGDKLFRFVWEQNNHDTKIIGFNVLNIRLRHEICEKWIREEKSVSYVIEHLKEINFNPELFRKYEKEIRNNWHQTLRNQRRVLI